MCEGVSHMSPEENKAFIRRFVEEVLNRGKLDLIPVFVAVDCVEHIPAFGQGLDAKV